MATSILTSLAFVGIVSLAAFIASIVFQRYRLPDIIFLIGLGAALGPVGGFVDVEAIRGILPFVGTLAVIIILFEGGLEIKLHELREGVVSGVLMAFVVFVLTTIIAGTAAVGVDGMSPANALLLGMIFGGAGVVIVIPLIQRMQVSHRATTIVTVEAVVSDVFVILGVFTASAAIALQDASPANFVVAFARTFLVALAVGAAIGVLWSKVLALHEGQTNEYVVTLAVLFLVYAATEALGGSGPLSVLVFGLIVGNTRARTRVAGPAAGTKTFMTIPIGRAPVFGEELVHFHHEAVFFIRAFFFVCLGVVLDLSVFRDARFLAGGLLMAAAVLVARALGTFIVFARSRLSTWDKLAIALMFPIGLIAAALSVIPYEQFGLPGTEHFPDYAAVVIVTTNLAATILVFGASVSGLRRRLERNEPATPPTVA